MKRLVSVIMACTLLVALSGCGETPKTTQTAIGNQEPKQTTPPESSGQPDIKQSETGEKTTASVKNANQMTVKVYFPDKQAINLVEKSAEIHWNTSETKYDAALKALFKAPDQSLTVVWKEQQVKLKFDNGSLFVDLDKTVQAGSTVERFMILSLLKTMFQFPEVQKVQLLVGGKKIETLGGHIEAEQPFTRKSLADL